VLDEDVFLFKKEHLNINEPTMSATVVETFSPMTAFPFKALHIVIK
jgi:hypothetical protein